MINLKWNSNKCEIKIFKIKMLSVIAWLLRFQTWYMKYWGGGTVLMCIPEVILPKYTYTFIHFNGGFSRSFFPFTQYIVKREGQKGIEKA